MSVLHVNQIAAKIQPLFEPHLDIADIANHDPERGVKILTRCLGCIRNLRGLRLLSRGSRRLRC